MERHSVERDVKEFCGWDRLSEIVEKIGELETPYPSKMLQALIATLFETGGRVSEVLKLRRGNFDLGSDSSLAIVKAMPVLKRKPETSTDRTIPIKRSDPLWPYIEAWLEDKKPDDILFDISRSKVWGLLKEIDEELYPHWFRAQRASQLAFEYGWDASRLSEFFAWKHFPTALKYARRGYKGLAEEMKK